MSAHVAETEDERVSDARARLEYDAKEGLPPGPWMEEPDFTEWWAGAYLCRIKRTRHMGSLCGYVGVLKGHPWYGRNAEFIGAEADVHGGVTWVDGESVFGKSVWLVGFDCAHGGDLAPRMLTLVPGRMRGDVYRDWAYVKGEVLRLLKQAEEASVAKNDP